MQPKNVPIHKKVSCHCKHPISLPEPDFEYIYYCAYIYYKIVILILLSYLLRRILVAL